MCLRVLLFFLVLPVFVFADVILVSDRDDFEDPDVFSVKQVKKQASLTFPYEIKDLSHEDWESSITNKKVVILVHGYNSDYELAMRCFSLVSEHCEDLYDTLICYLWPGGDNIWEYHQARSQVLGMDLPLRFMALLQELSENSSHLDILAHSMGCRLALETLILPSPPLIQNLFMIAPAVDDDSLDQDGVYVSASSKCDDIFVFFSKNDTVLKWGYPLLEWDHSLGAWGSETPETLPSNVHVIDATEHVFGHKHYLKSDFIYDMIADRVRLSMKHEDEEL